MISNFTYFLYNNNLNDYMNCYSTFLMTRKDLKDNVLNHRMNLLINYYTNEEKLEQINRQKLIQYYISSYKDDYIKPSLDIDANNNNNNNNNNDNDNNANNDVDVEDHYKYMFVNTKPKPPVIDYDEIDKEYALKLELEEEEKQREKEIQLENDYDDYYDDDENYDILNDDFSDEDNIEYDYGY